MIRLNYIRFAYESNRFSEFYHYSKFEALEARSKHQYESFGLSFLIIKLFHYAIRNANEDVEIVDVGHWLSNVSYDGHNEENINETIDYNIHESFRLVYFFFYLFLWYHHWLSPAQHLAIHGLLFSCFHSISIIIIHKSAILFDWRLQKCFTI